jgi:hypothetical protein
MNIKASIENTSLKKRGWYAVFGNCQAPLIADFLETSPKFNSFFSKIELPGVHEITGQQLNDFKNKAKSLSIFIYQNVKRDHFDTESIISLLPENCIKISIPSLFFNAYNPEVAYIRESRANIVYHDRLQLKLINDFDFFQDALLSSLNYYPEDFSKECLRLSMGELRRRELDQNIKIPISDYILEKYQFERLFHVLNHPSQDLIKTLSVRILKYLGIGSEIDQVISSYYLDRWQFPVYRSHFNNLGLVFDNPSIYRWDGVPYTPEDFFNRQKKYYSTIPFEILAQQSFDFIPPVLRSWDLAAEFDFKKTDCIEQ